MKKKIVELLSWIAFWSTLFAMAFAIGYYNRDQKTTVRHIDFPEEIDQVKTGDTIYVQIVNEQITLTFIEISGSKAYTVKR